ncbi:glycoside hydrolase family 2 TIM barrel-domain containing protein [Flammeovirgaceae bacterium SG7u.111]|nr:glycoside hydrolase family 2 TIM barrel-domain containing protein [Flammeovirgaceae bacterium SG7u.132]WPO34614.1 glycoside hydrolase family 2 TIM barrel-domain containing protein [Flammeovirgaceae bacterium SG7u.111]
MKYFKYPLLISFIMALSNLAVIGQEAQITNIGNRESMTLNGVWKYIVDPYETGYYDYRREVRDEQANPSTAESLFLGYKRQSPSDRVEYDFEKADNILVPRDWNSQKEKLYYYEGSVWYFKAFDYKKETNNKRQFLYFGAVNYEADVYLNGKKLGKHVGGFTPFNFEVTGKLKPEGNFLILKVDNTRGLEKVPTINTDWWNYGGITRDVEIIEVAETFIQDYYVQLALDNTEELEVSVTLNGPNKASQEVTVEIPEAKVIATLITNSEGIAEGKIKVKKLKLWSPETPYLNDVKLIHSGNVLTDKIGFRTLTTKGADILVNGKSVFLRGICIHEENGIRGGRAYSEEDARMLLGWAKELGCNFVRLAHYPHNENMTRVADELGIMVWSEVPVYWTIQWKNEATFSNAKAQLTDMITRDKNRASVIIWSMANETPVSPDRTEFLKKMIETANDLDPVRLISAALERHTKKGTKNTQVIEDPLQEYVDIIAFNQYIGWYAGLPEDCKTAEFDIQFNKPVVISEFGAGALQGLYGSKEERWTEEFQEYLFDETLKMLEKIPQLRGTNPWILADFRSPRRVLPDIQDGWNRKGLISEVGEKKKAFYVLKNYYEVKQTEYVEKNQKK